MHLRRLLVVFALLAVLCAAGPADVPAAPAAYNMTLLGSLALTPSGTTTDLWVEGTHAYVGRGTRGLSVVDVSNPALPVKLTDWNPSGEDIGDVAVNGTRCYLSSQGSNGVGVYILDVSDPANPQTIGTISSPTTNSVHTLYIDGFTLYCSSNSTGDLRIWDVTNASAPVERGHASPGGWHESTVMDGICYMAAGTANLHIYDVTNPSAPQQIGQAQYNRPDTVWYTHTAWPSADARSLFTCDEYTDPNPGSWRNGGLRVWDISNIAMPVQKATWKTDTGLSNANVTIHKVKVTGNFLDASYYQDGVRVLDVTDPGIPIEVGFFDTYPSQPTELFQGCWGVIRSDGLIYASDRSYGLFILSHNGTLGGSMTGTVTSSVNGLPIRKATISFQEATRRVRSTASGAYTVRTGAGVHTVQVSAAGYQTLTTAVELAAGTTLTQDFELTPLAGVGPQVSDASTETASTAAIAILPTLLADGGTVHLALDLPAHVAVRLFDHTGREVSRLVDGTFPAGVSGVRFALRRDDGRELPRGVYWWRATLEGAVQTGRVIVAR